MHPRSRTRSSTSSPRSAPSASASTTTRRAPRSAPSTAACRTRDIPETHDVLLARARVLHPGETIPDDAPSRFKKDGAADAAPAARRIGGARAEGRGRSRRRRRRVAAVPVEDAQLGLAIPPPEEWEVPIHCFRCQGEYEVPVRDLPGRHRVPLPALPRLLRSHAQHGARRRATRSSASTPRGRTPSSASTTKRQRELEQFEERQRQELGPVRAGASAASPRAARARRPHQAAAVLVLLTTAADAGGGAAASPRIPARSARRSEPADLLALVFTGQGRDPEFGTRFLDVLLGGDSRFRFDVDARRWHARAHDAPLPADRRDRPSWSSTSRRRVAAPRAAASSRSAPCACVDGRLLDTFSTLVNPGRPIQPFVAALTGITDAMVASAPPIAEALPRFLEFAGDAVLVAHNAPLRRQPSGCGASRDHRAARSTSPALCTLRLARRLLPEQRRRSLDAVAASLGHRLLRPPPRPRRRAHRGGDPVRVPRAGRRARRHARLSELLALQHAASDGEPFVVHVSRERLGEIPADARGLPSARRRTAACSTSARHGACARGSGTGSATRADTRGGRSS